MALSQRPVDRPNGPTQKSSATRQREVPSQRSGPATHPTHEGNPDAAADAAWKASVFGEVYSEHSRQIYYLALRFLGDPQKAEDATHDVFLKAFRKIDQFRGDASWRTWLYRITINHCRNLQQAWHDRHMISNADEAVWETTPAKADSPLRVLETKELGNRIQQALEVLPPEYRLLLLLVADEDLSYEEIAELTQQTADAVRGKLHRARKAFKEQFSKSA